MSDISSHDKNIEFIPAICPKCGGELRVPKNRDVIKCMYCGGNILLQVHKKDDSKPNLDTITHLAKIAFEGKNYNEAYHYYSIALEEAPNEAIYWAGKGVSAACLSDLSIIRFEEAIHCIQEAVRLGLRNHSEWFSFTAWTFGHCLYTYTNQVVTLLESEWERKHNIDNYGELQDVLTDRFFSDYGGVIQKSVNFLWEVMPCQESAEEIRSINSLFRGTFSWKSYRDNRLNPGSSPLFLSSLLSKIMSESSDPFGDRAAEAIFRKHAIESNPKWERYYNEKSYDKIIRSVLAVMIQKYHSNSGLLVELLPLEDDPSVNYHIWYLYEEEDDTIDWDQNTSLLGIWLVCDQNYQIVGYEFYRRGYGIHRCGLSKDELLSSLVTLEENIRKQEAKKYK